MLEHSARHSRIGIGLITLTTLSFALLDTTAKWLVLSLPVLQVVWLRFLTHSLFSLAIFGPRMGRALVHWRKPRLQVLRGLMLACMTGLNFWALQYLQLAETAAMQFSVPILIAVLSAWWLGERLDLRRWLAIGAGFIGVLIIVRPGTQAFQPAIVLSAGNAILYALFNLLTRQLSSAEHPATMQLASAMVSTAVLTPFALWTWQTPDSALQWALLAVAGLSGGAGHYFAAQAHRFASASLLGPFLYQQILYMILGGWLVFGQVPDQAVLLGAGVVVSSGLYLLWREFEFAPQDLG